MTFANRRGIAKHISRIRKSTRTPDADHRAIYGDELSPLDPVEQPLLGAGINVAALPLVAAAIVNNDVDDEIVMIVVETVDDYYNDDYNDDNNDDNNSNNYAAGADTKEPLEMRRLPPGSTEPPDYSVVQRFQEHIESGNGRRFSTAAFKSDIIALLHMLKKAIATISLFDGVKKWATDTKSKFRTAVLSDIHIRVDSAGSLPKTVEVQLPGSGHKALPCFSSIKCISMF
jgi:hypothetical protein